MSADTAPILLRPTPALADAMTAAAEARGISRQAWMLAVLEGACSEYMTAITPDDVPLPLYWIHACDVRRNFRGSAAVFHVPTGEACGACGKDESE